MGDWALNASIVGGEIVVEQQVDGGLPEGLGAPTTTRLQPHGSLPLNAVALANQWEPDSSLFFAGPPIEFGDAAVSPQPGPGSYSAAVDVTFLAQAGTEVRFRVDRDEWQAGRGPTSIVESTTLEYYGVSVAGQPSPIQKARYVIGSPLAELPDELRQDSDGNGLEDAWERLFFGNIGVPPDDDPDGDGAATRYEYEAGTDPLNPESRPPPDPSTLQIIAMFDPATGISLRLEQVVGAVVTVEISTDLATWEPAANPPQYNPDGSVEWHEMSPPGVIRYFRVRFDLQQ